MTRLDVSGGDLAIQKAARSDAESELAALSPHIPAVIIELKGASSADIAIDGRAIASSLLGAAIPIDPGSHTFRATSEGRAVEQTASFVADTEPEHVVLDFGGGSAAAPPAPAALVHGTRTEATSPHASDMAANGSARRTIGLVTAGVGVVGLGVGAFFYFKAKADNNEAKGICPSSTDCAAADIQRHGGLVEDVKTGRTLSYVSLGIGAAGLVGGAVLYLTAPKGQSTAARHPLRWALAPLPQGGCVGFVGGNLP